MKSWCRLKIKGRVSSRDKAMTIFKNRSQGHVSVEVLSEVWKSIPLPMVRSLSFYIDICYIDVLQKHIYDNISSLLLNGSHVILNGSFDIKLNRQVTICVLTGGSRGWKNTTETNWFAFALCYVHFIFQPTC